MEIKLTKICSCPKTASRYPSFTRFGLIEKCRDILLNSCQNRNHLTTTDAENTKQVPWAEVSMAPRGVKSASFYLKNGMSWRNMLLHKVPFI